MPYPTMGVPNIRSPQLEMIEALKRRLAPHLMPPTAIPGSPVNTNNQSPFGPPSFAQGSPMPFGGMMPPQLMASPAMQQANPLAMFLRPPGTRTGSMVSLT